MAISRDPVFGLQGATRLFANGRWVKVRTMGTQLRKLTQVLRSAASQIPPHLLMTRDSWMVTDLHVPQAGVTLCSFRNAGAVSL